VFVLLGYAAVLRRRRPVHS